MAGFIESFVPSVSLALVEGGFCVLGAELNMSIDCSLSDFLHVTGGSPMEAYIGNLTLVLVSVHTMYI